MALLLGITLRELLSELLLILLFVIVIGVLPLVCMI